MLAWPPEIPLSSSRRRRWERVGWRLFHEEAQRLRLEIDRDTVYREVYVPLALWIDQQVRGARPCLIGVSGGQGSGKTTFCRLLEVLLETVGQRRVLTLSIDDLYLTRADRRKLAEDVHPLLETRGPPGTHDVELGLRLLDRLAAAGPADRTPIPSFDKSADDRRPQREWPLFEGRPEVVLFEGWCVGAGPQTATELVAPINDLERERDREGIWRSWVNQRLETDYRRLFSRIDGLLLLRVPSLEKIREWRKLQERRLVDSGAAGDRIMSAREIDTFIQHYERITRHSLKEMSGRVDLCLQLGNNHQVESMEAAARPPRELHGAPRRRADRD